MNAKKAKLYITHKIYNIFLNKTYCCIQLHTHSNCLKHSGTERSQNRWFQADFERSRPNHGSTQLCRLDHGQFGTEKKYESWFMIKPVITDFRSFPISDFQEILPNKLMFENNQFWWEFVIFLKFVFGKLLLVCMIAFFRNSTF